MTTLSRYDLADRVNDRARITINLRANDYITLFAALCRAIYYVKEETGQNVRNLLLWL